ncbi:MAG: TetR/AcrR family transcriptional regulator [Burkholderiales bacterium]|nr:TetR/AcrR family transcriptional regulator [Burkholderiales bacterium]
MTKPTRSYVSSLRAESASRTRTQLIAAAAQLLREQDDFRAVTLDAVARAAGVTRLTVYHQFGSRRGLLETVFDDLALRGGLQRIGAAMAMPQARAAIASLIGVFCDFWAGDVAVGRLNVAAAADAELAEAVAQRNERRREAMGVLVERHTAGRPVTAEARAEVVDLLYGLTGYSMFKALSANRSPAAVCRLLQRTAARLLDELEA